jgi:hypothetical protein
VLAIPAQQLRVVAEGFPAVFSELKSFYKDRTSGAAGAGKQADEHFEEIFKAITSLDETDVMGQVIYTYIDAEVMKSLGEAKLNMLVSEINSIADANIIESLGEEEFKKLNDTKKDKLRQTRGAKMQSEINARIDAEIKKSLGEEKFETKKYMAKTVLRKMRRAKMQPDFESEINARIDAEIKKSLGEEKFKMLKGSAIKEISYTYIDAEVMKSLGEANLNMLVSNINCMADASVIESLGEEEFKKLNDAKKDKYRQTHRAVMQTDFETEIKARIDAEIKKSLGEKWFKKLNDTEKDERRQPRRAEMQTDLENEINAGVDADIKMSLGKSAFKMLKGSTINAIADAEINESPAEKLRERILGNIIGSVLLARRDEVCPAPELREPGGAEKVGLGGSTWNRLRNAALGCLELLDVYWETVPPAQAFVEPGSGEGKKTGGGGDGKSDAGPPNPAPVLSKPALDWIHSAGDLLALQVVCAISRCTIPLSNLVIYLSVAPLLLLLSIATYPVQPQRFLQVCFWALLLAVLLGVIWVYISRERDELLSRVSGTTPNAITFDREFLGGVMAFVTPIFALVLAQFPFFSDLLHQWLEPLGRIIR